MGCFIIINKSIVNFDQNQKEKCFFVKTMYFTKKHFFLILKQNYFSIKPNTIGKSLNKT